MKQVYHTNATTNMRLPSEIKKSKESTASLSERYNVSENTIRKWRNRDI